MATVCEDFAIFRKTRDARRESGHQLNRVQQGWEPKDWKPMSTVGPGVREIRIHQAGEFRVLYVANLPEAIYVLSAFEKRTRRTPQRELELAMDRFRSVSEERRRQRR